MKISLYFKPDYKENYKETLSKIVGLTNVNDKYAPQYGLVLAEVADDNVLTAIEDINEIESVKRL